MAKTFLIACTIFILITLSLPSDLAVEAVDGRAESQLATLSTSIENQDNRPVENVIDAFDNLPYQGEWLGFHIGPYPPISSSGGATTGGREFELFPKPFDHHIQGMARSPRTDVPPVFYFSHSGTVGDTNSFPGLMVVEMNSLAQDGERLGSNRLMADGYETIDTLPPWDDKVTKIFEYDDWHPSGIAMVGDILAVPIGGSIIFYDCSVPNSPMLMDYKLAIKSDIESVEAIKTIGPFSDADFAELNNDILTPRLWVFFNDFYLPQLSADAYLVKHGEGNWVIWDKERDYNLVQSGNNIEVYDVKDLPPWSHGGQAVAITRIQGSSDADSFFLLMTNTGEGAHFHWSNSGDFSDPNFRFNYYQHLTTDDLAVLDDQGFWSLKKPIFQNLTFVNQTDGGLFLIGALNTKDYSPTMFPFGRSYDQMIWFGKDELSLLMMLKFARPAKNMYPPDRNPDGWNEESKIELRGWDVKRSMLRSPGRASPGGEVQWYKFKEEICIEDWPSIFCGDLNKYMSERWQANYNAGATAYVSPLGELLYYGVSHWADGEPGSQTPDEQNHFDRYILGDYVKMAEFSHRDMTSRLGSPCGPVYFDNQLGKHITVKVGADPVVLSAENYMIEPWVRMYQSRNRTRRRSVTMDWRTQTQDDYYDFNLLDGTRQDCKETNSEGFANCMSSLAWCLPQYAELTIYNEPDNEGDFRRFTGSEALGGFGYAEYIVLHRTGDLLSNTFEDKAESVEIIWKDSAGVVRSPDTLEDSYEWELSGTGDGTMDIDPGNSLLVTYTPGQTVSNEVVKLTFMDQFETNTTFHVGTNPANIDGVAVNSTASAGENVTVNGLWSDPNNKSVSLKVDWGDGTIQQKTITGTGDTDTGYDGNFAGSHVYEKGGSYTISVMVQDDEVPTYRFIPITVDNIPPLVEAGADQSIDEGGTLALEPAIYSDPITSADDLVCNPTCQLAPGVIYGATVDWGDGTIELSPVVTSSIKIDTNLKVTNEGTIAASHTYADDGLYSVEVCIMDDDLEESCDSFTATVSNVSPEITVGGDKNVIEGELVGIDPVSIIDPGYDCPNCDPPTTEDFTATVDWGDGTVEPDVDIIVTEVQGSAGTETTGSIQAAHHYADNGEYQVEVCVSDDDDGEDCGYFQISVNNDAPTLDAGKDTIAIEGDIFELDSATFSDPGFDCELCDTLEDFEATVDWGDGTTSTVSETTVVESFGSEGVKTTGTIAANHQYLMPPGVYTITVCVVDDDGGQDCDSLEVTLVHRFMGFCAYANEKDFQLEESAKLDCRIGGMDKIELKKESTVTGDVEGGDDVKLEENSRVGGTVYAAGKVETKQNAEIAGGYVENADILHVTQVDVKVHAGGSDETVKKGSSKELVEGSYGKLTVKEGGTLQLVDGTYSFESVKVEKNATLEFSISSDGWTILEVQKGLEIGEGAKMDVITGEASDILIKVGGNSVKLGKDAVLSGTFIAPEAHIDVHEDAQLDGVLYGESVQIKKSADIWYVPALRPFIEEYLR